MSDHELEFLKETKNERTARRMFGVIRTMLVSNFALVLTSAVFIILINTGHFDIPAASTVTKEHKKIQDTVNIISVKLDKLNPNGK